MTSTPPRRPVVAKVRVGRIRDRHVILIALAIQAMCAAFFLSDILSSYIGIGSRPIPWQAREIIEIGAGFGLVLGFALGGLALRRSRQRHQQAEALLKRAASAFMDVVEDAFAEWALTPAEKDVALFLLKGLSTQDIAGLRSTSEGTVKAQTNAIYRKAGVSGRSQLLSLFIEELMDASLVDPAMNNGEQSHERVDADPFTDPGAVAPRASRQ